MPKRASATENKRSKQNKRSNNNWKSHNKINNTPSELRRKRINS